MRKALPTIIALFPMLTLLIIPVFAQTTIYLDPSVIEKDVSVFPVGSRFNVTVWISDVTDLFGFQVALYCNSTVLNITKCWLPTWNSSYVFYGQAGIPVGPNYEESGIWKVALVGFSGLAGITTSFSGSGLLAIFEFETVTSPPDGTLVTDLIISYKPTGGPFDTKLRNSAALVIPFNGEDGEFRYVPEFSSLLLLPIFAILMLVALVLSRRARLNARIHQ